MPSKHTTLLLFDGLLEGLQRPARFTLSRLTPAAHRVPASCHPGTQIAMFETLQNSVGDITQGVFGPIAGGCRSCQRRKIGTSSPGQTVAKPSSFLQALINWLSGPRYTRSSFLLGLANDPTLVEKVTEQQLPCAYR